MKHGISKGLAAIFCYCIPAWAFSASDDGGQSALVVNGTLWMNYVYDATKDSAHKNGFDVYRAFLRANYKIDPTWSTSLLLDSQRGETLAVKSDVKTGGSGIHK